MSQQQHPAPPPKWGILPPGEIRTIQLPVLPNGYMPVLQNFPGRSVSLKTQDAKSMTIANEGSTAAPFTIMFINEGQMRKLIALKNLAMTISNRGGPRK